MWYAPRPIREDTEHRQDIMIKVVQFNNQIRQCKISAMADSVAEQRYEMVMERFINGTADVTDLNTAQERKGRSGEPLHSGTEQLLVVLL